MSASLTVTLETLLNREEYPVAPRQWILAPRPVGDSMNKFFCALKALQEAGGLSLFASDALHPLKPEEGHLSLLSLSLTTALNVDTYFPESIMAAFPPHSLSAGR